MSTEFTFPLALCKAQYGIWLHALEWFETAGSRVLQDGIALTRAQSDAVMRAEDWRTLAMAPMHAFRRPDADHAFHASSIASTAQGRIVEALPSRRTEVNDALCTLRGALATAPSAPHASGRARRRQVLAQR